MQEQINNLQNRIKELENILNNKKIQQISFPLDDISKIIIQDKLSTVSTNGTGSATTQNINLTGNAQTITVPAQPTGTLKLVVNGTTYELLYK